MSVHDLWKDNVRKVTKSGHESNKRGRFRLCGKLKMLIR